MTESDFPRPCIIGYGSSPSRCRPGRFVAAGRTWDLPVPAQRASTHARFFDHAGPSGHSRSRARPYRLPPSQQRRHPGYKSFEAQWLAYVLPCRRFADDLTDGNARLGADVDRYSLITSDLHRLLVAGLPAHCERFCTLSISRPGGTTSPLDHRADRGVDHPLLVCEPSRSKICRRFTMTGGSHRSIDRFFVRMD